jgi:hypothetical protein
MRHLCGCPPHIKDSSKSAVTYGLHHCNIAPKESACHASSKHRGEGNGNQQGTSSMPYFEMSKAVDLEKKSIKKEASITLILRRKNRMT